MIAKKTWIKMLSLVLLLPIMLAFTACANGNAQLNTKATCNTSGEYNQEATKDALMETVGEQTAIDGEGYRLTIDMSGSANGENMNVYLNAIIKGDDAAAKMKVNTPETNEEGYMYLKDGYMYVEHEGVKAKMQGNINMLLSGMQEFDESMESMPSFYDVESILETIDSSDISVYIEGNNYKIEFTHLGGDMFNTAESPLPMSFDDVVSFLNFDDEGKLTAITFSFKMSMEMDLSSFIDDPSITTDMPEKVSTEMNFSVTMSTFDGEIQFPTLEDYAEMDL